MECPLVTSLTVRKTNPAAIVQDSTLQGDRRALSTLAAGDESPMNFHETHVLQTSKDPVVPLVRARPKGL
jgi:hypothetical protein